MNRLLLALSALSCALLSACASTPLIEKEPADLAVEHMLQSISEALDTVHSRHAGGDFDLEVTEVVVQLETVADEGLSGELTISVIEIDAEREREITQKLKLTLEPPRQAADAAMSPSRPAHPRLVEELEVGLDAAYLAARGARTGLQRMDSGKVPLEAKTIEVEVEFDVTTTEDGVPTISILGLDLEREREASHKVTLTFEIVSGKNSA
ncbi:MAG: trypco2 family protein [Acidobacteriota bacterium]